LTDQENLQREVEALSKNLKALNESSFGTKINDLNSKVLRLEDHYKNLVTKISEENLAEEIEGLKAALDQLRFELDKKADRSLIADVYSKANEPKQDQAQEKYDFNEF
jgi:hypothetical protein